MKKFIIAGVATAALLLAGTASAATISNARFSNNDVTIDATGNATVSGTFTITVAPNEAIEWGRATVNGITTDFSIGGNLGDQEGVTNNVPFTVKVPPNTGTYNVDLSGDGIYGASRAVSPVDVNANSWMGSTNVGTVRVVANGDTTIGGSVVGSAQWMADLIAALKAALGGSTPAPTTSAVCTAYAQASAGAIMGTTNSANVRLQGFLLSQGASIPALAAGASFGFYGNQTASAVAWFNSLNHCN